MGADRAKHASKAFDYILRRGFGTSLRVIPTRLDTDTCP